MYNNSDMLMEIAQQTHEKLQKGEAFLDKEMKRSCIKINLPTLFADLFGQSRRKIWPLMKNIWSPSSGWAS
jgi:hypothetical protein